MEEKIKLKKYYISDYETGQLVEVTKEQHDSYYEAMNRMWDATRPKLDKPLGVIMFGTGGESNWDEGKFRKLWEESNSSYRLLFVESSEMEIVEPIFYYPGVNYVAGIDPYGNLDEEKPSDIKIFKNGKELQNNKGEDKG